MPEPGDEAARLLRKLTGDPNATFREDQFEAIEAATERAARQLLVQRTGWGKSAVYFIATRILRNRGIGPTILISPLLALMRNQIEAAERMGLRAVTINSANQEEWGAIKRELAADEVDLLLVSAPRLANTEFVDDVLPNIARTTGLLVVDEAHCISDWGHDFVPDYRRVVRVLERLPRGIPVVCCTATANDRVVNDITRQLGSDLVIRRGPLARQSLELHVVDLPRPAQRLAWLRRHLDDLPGTGIIYCLTVGDAERIAACMASDGHDVTAYTGQTDLRDRLDIERRLLNNSIKAVVATSALGMGFDKPDLGFVVHYQAPGTAIAYYQQVGRAGRSLDQAVGVLLRGNEDVDIQDWFITTAFPDPDTANDVVALLAQAGEPVSIRAIEAEVNVRHSRLEAMLKILEVEGAVERVGGGYRRTLAGWSYDHDRVERVTAARRHEQAQMSRYGASTTCRMQFLSAELDDPHAAPCGRCDNCRANDPNGLHEPTEPAEVARALECLRHNEQIIQPRKQWPFGLSDPHGPIPAELQLDPGQALSRWGDGGWSELVRRGKQEDGRFDEKLVAVSVDALSHSMTAERPTWVTCVPSRKHPELVPRFAEQLAEALGLAFRPIVAKVRDTEQQKTMENSAQQVRNIWGAFSVRGPVPCEPVLLVDDVVDSRWTLTVVGSLLRKAGVPSVTPFALCQALGQ